MKINMKTKDPNLDFFTKSFLLLLLVPIVSLYTWLSGLYLFGKSTWSSPWEGGFAFAVWGAISGFYIFLFALLVVSTFILFFNKKFMSGDKLKAPTKIGLFLLAFVLYLATLYLITLFM